MSNPRTRVIASTGDPGKWQAQYYDANMKLWFDIGDAQKGKAEAEKRATEHAATDPRFAHLNDPAERAWLTNLAPSDVVTNAHRFYDYMGECGVPEDSYTRELAFAKAADDLGMDYDILYNAWLYQTPIPAV